MLIFPYKSHFFEVFGAFEAKNLEFYIPKIPIFLKLGPSPLGRGLFPQTFGFHATALAIISCFRYLPRITLLNSALNVVVFDVDDNDEVEDRNSNSDTNRRTERETCMST